MLGRFPRILVAILMASSVAVPAAFASGTAHPSRTVTDRSSASALAMLSTIERVQIGANSTVVTVQDGSKSHPIVIEYGEALRTGVLGTTENGASARAGKASGAETSSLPRGLTLGQIAAWMLGLTLISRMLTVARQVVAVKGRR